MHSTVKAVRGQVVVVQPFDEIAIRQAIRKAIRQAIRKAIRKL